MSESEIQLRRTGSFEAYSTSRRKKSSRMRPVIVTMCVLVGIVGFAWAAYLFEGARGTTLAFPPPAEIADAVSKAPDVASLTFDGSTLRATFKRELSNDEAAGLAHGVAIQISGSKAERGHTVTRCTYVLADSSGPVVSLTARNGVEVDREWLR